MTDGYILCGTPRSGSTLLCRMLSATKASGEPDSFFATQFIDEWAEAWGLLPRKNTINWNAHYLQAAIQAGKGSTPIFGLRLMAESRNDLLTMLDRLFPGLPSDRSRIKRAFGNVLFVHLSRADKVAQAVSRVKAEQSGLWHAAPDGREIERLGPPKELRYDHSRIHDEVTRLEEQDVEWRNWFSREAIEPLQIGYETLAADPSRVLAALCHVLGLPPPPDGIRPEVARLADDISAEWVRRYRSESTAASPAPPVAR